MEKKSFIQQVVIHYRQPADKAEDAIRYAESLWDALTAHGYGTPQKGAERITEDYYGKLLPDQKDKFDKFWIAFRKKDGKQKAARSWARISPDDELFRSIMKGAEYEARIRNDRKTDPPWAEKWLNERRWEDTQTEAVVVEQKPVEDQGHRRHCLEMAKTFERMGDTQQAKYWNDEAEKASVHN